MFSFGPTPPPPLHSLILRSILQHLHHGYGVPVPGRPIAGFPPVLQPPVQVNPPTPVPRPAPGGINGGPDQPPSVYPAPRPTPPSINGGPDQPPSIIHTVVAPDPYGGGYGPPRGLVHRVLSGLL